jgi:hypothetical protein
MGITGKESVFVRLCYTGELLGERFLVFWSVGYVGGDLGLHEFDG